MVWARDRRNREQKRKASYTTWQHSTFTTLVSKYHYSLLHCCPGFILSRLAIRDGDSYNLSRTCWVQNKVFYILNWCASVSTCMYCGLESTNLTIYSCLLGRVHRDHSTCQWYDVYVCVCVRGHVRVCVCVCEYMYACHACVVAINYLYYIHSRSPMLECIHCIAGFIRALGTPSRQGCRLARNTKAGSVAATQTPFPPHIYGVRRRIRALCTPPCHCRDFAR